MTLRGRRGSAAATARAEREAPRRASRTPPPVIVPDPAAAAFFDLDNTMVQGAALFQLAKELHRRGIFPTRLVVKGIWLQAYFRLVGREKPAHIRQAREAALVFIAGQRVAEIRSAGEDVYAEAIAPRVWTGTRALAQLHLDAGQPVWLVTAAPIEVAEVIASRLGLTGALGTTAEHEDGVYTGRLRGGLLHGAEKAVAVVALAEQHGWDLTRCFAYSDSANDLPMLTEVGHPCAVNPDVRLARHANRNGWPIRDYRSHRRMVRRGLAGVVVAGALGGALLAVAAVRRPGSPRRRRG